MKRVTALLLVLLALLPAGVSAERSRALELALSMLEEGNPFLVRYNAENGTDTAEAAARNTPRARPPMNGLEARSPSMAFASGRGASSTCVALHRGLSGMKKASTRKSAAGTASAPNMMRQETSDGAMRKTM